MQSLARELMPEPEPKPLSILLLEDNELDARLVTTQLEEVGMPFRLERVEGRESFMRALERGGYDIILSDYNIPGFDGVSALAAVRRVLPDIPFLFVTGALGEERAIELLKRGATDYVLKNRLERLVPSVERALRQAESEQLRRETEKALRKSEERYQLVIRATSDVVWDWDLEKGTVEWSDSIETMFGITRREMEADTDAWLARVHPEERERVWQGMQQALTSRVDRWQAEYRFQRANGTYAFVVDRGYIVRDEGGQAQRMAGAMQDITEQKRSEEERQQLLSEARRRVEFEQQLVGIVSHDLRGPLNAILTGASMMLQRETIEPWQAKTAARILSCAERSNRLIRDLLDFTQARMGGGIPVRPASADLHEVTQQVVEEARAVHVERNILVTQGGEGRGEWDADRMAQVVSNLVTNALKYSPEGTQVRVETVGEPERMVLRVHNVGEPIAADLLPRIFEPLRRGKRRTNRSDRSIGLGLYIVRELVLAHGGTVEVNSTEAEGTTFTVSLPRTIPVLSAEPPAID
ncbi:sensor histidine kinase [Hyalangium rubrum]|uniref:histidine kinase n=1 Tax=Hyalangium rubrum TaxID=3103134 RepID=A0ABU5HD97_9BACT|nr:ATP-binding protein [Hyalangium sp. s54d21]MDY7231441.1 ATP-binding protein [Hyalangium sp. s54d21]